MGLPKVSLLTLMTLLSGVLVIGNHPKQFFGLDFFCASYSKMALAIDFLCFHCQKKSIEITSGDSNRSFVELFVQKQFFLVSLLPKLCPSY